MGNFLLYFLSGILLNVMPCVLPILSIKIYDIIKYSQTEENEKNLKIVSIGTIAGIISVFCSFGIVAILLKSLGRGFNIGFHFQNPYFLIFAIFLLFIFELNLLNFFNVHYSPRIVDFLQKKYDISKKLSTGIFFNNFFTGIFMVLFATPCCLPIIGTVATFSIADESYFQILNNFFITGLGMSFPFLFIIFFPKKLKFLKNYKNLLKYVNNFIIFVIFFTILWLLLILEIQIGVRALLIVVVLLGLLFLQFKFIKKSKSRSLIIAIIILIGVVLPVMIYNNEQIKKEKISIWKNSISLEEIDNYLSEDKNIFLSITARWCMVCNLNDTLVFSRNRVINYFNKNRTILVEMDVTNSNDEVLKFFDNHDRIAVPTYIVFNKKYPNGCKFSGKLYEGSFFREIKKCN